jgi:hypothetical protein
LRQFLANQKLPPLTSAINLSYNPTTGQQPTIVRSATMRADIPLRGSPNHERRRQFS